jgi:hypothetical protein
VCISFLPYLFYDHHASFTRSTDRATLHIERCVDKARAVSSQAAKSQHQDGAPARWCRHRLAGRSETCGL